MKACFRKGFAACAVSVLLLGAEGCSQSTGTPASGSAAAPAAAFSPKTAIKIEQLDWKVEPSIVNDRRCLSLNYTNHSSYTIMEVKMNFVLKDAITEEQRKLFDGIKKQYEFVFNDEKDYSDMYLTADNQRFADPGADAADSSIGINGWLVPIETMEQYELFEPDIVRIAFIGNDGRGYNVQYDFKNQAYGGSGTQGVNLHSWGTGKMCQLLPQFDFRVTSVNQDSDDKFVASAYGADAETYNAYAEKVKAAGFDQDCFVASDNYKGKNADGVEAVVSYYEMDQTVEIYVSAD